MQHTLLTKHADDKGRAKEGCFEPPIASIFACVAMLGEIFQLSWG